MEFDIKINCISSMKGCGTEPNYRRGNRCLSHRYLSHIRADWEVLLLYPCITDEAVRAATINKSLSCIVGLPYLQIQKRGHFGRGGGGGVGVSYFTSGLFVCEGEPLIKCNGEKKNSSSNLMLPHFYSP